MDYENIRVRDLGLTDLVSGLNILADHADFEEAKRVYFEAASISKSGFLHKDDFKVFSEKQDALTDPITGTGTTGLLPFFSGSTELAADANLAWDNVKKMLVTSNFAPVNDYYNEPSGYNFYKADKTTKVARLDTYENSLYIYQNGVNAVSTATQKSSGSLIFETSSWNGSVEEKNNYSLLAYSDPSADGLNYLLLSSTNLSKIAELGNDRFALWDNDSLFRYFYCDNTTQKVVIGSSTPVTAFTVVDTIGTSPRGIMSFQTSTDSSGSRVHLRKARGTQASPLTVVSADMLGRIVSSGYIGSTNTYKEAASIDFVTSGTINDTGTGRLPTYIAFSTMPNANSATLTEALRINSDQSLSYSKWKPLADSTTAYTIYKADGSSIIQQYDSTNVRIGIGIAPVTKLHASAGAAGTSIAFKLSIPTTTGEGAAQGYDFALDTSGNARVWNYSSTYLSFATANTERMRIAANGDVSIVSMAPASPAMVESSTGGIVSATKLIIEAYITDATGKSNLENTGNWTGVNYTGATVSAYQGQLHYNATYIFVCVFDDTWIRIARV